MGRVVGLLMAVVLGAALALFFGRGDADGDAPGDAALDLPSGSVRLTIVQRHSEDVPGSGGRLRVHIGDITRGQVQLTLSHADGRGLIAPTSVRQGDRLGFSFGGRRYRLTVLELNNLLMGNDTAVLEFSDGGSDPDRIERLLRAVEASGLTFYRNGVAHDAADAASHLRRKWKASGDRIRTAEQFVEHVATRSSITGKLYEVQLTDGRRVQTRAWLLERLHDS